MVKVGVGFLYIRGFFGGEDLLKVILIDKEVDRESV